MKESRTATLLKSMLHALEVGDHDTYWVSFGMLLEVHDEKMRELIMPKLTHEPKETP